MEIKLVPLPGSTKNDGSSLHLYLFRHGYTRYNLENRYQGKTDLPLVKEEFERIRPFILDPVNEAHNVVLQDQERCADSEGRDAVYVSPALRARQTAKLLFPDINQIVIPQFEEMNFGIFEGRTADEMSEDPRYRSWVDSMCEDKVPGGESRAQFASRVAHSFCRLAMQALRERRKRLLIVAHGGVQMAVMERFCVENRPYWSWQSAPGEAVETLVSEKE